ENVDQAGDMVATSAVPFEAHAPLVSAVTGQISWRRPPSPILRPSLDPCTQADAASQQLAERAEVDVQLLAADAQLGGQLSHLLVELHQRQPHALDLLVREPAAVHPPHGLPARAAGARTA